MPNILDLCLENILNELEPDSQIHQSHSVRTLWIEDTSDWDRVKVEEWKMSIFV